MSDTTIENSPYASPEAQQHPPFPPHDERSSVPKVFGILHIIYASLGLLIGFWGFVSAAVMKGLPMKSASDEALAKFMNAMEAQQTYVYIDAGVRVILGVILLMSGIKLLKYKAAGLRQSNIWVVTRIVWLIIFTIISYSANEAVQQASLEMNPEMAPMLESIGKFSLISGVVMMLIYPIVSYLMLNRAKVRKDLE